MTAQTFTIGKAAKGSGLTPKLIRYYESIGLIPRAQRSESGPHSLGYRRFTLEEIGHLELVAKTRSLGFQLKDIADLLQCVDEGCCSTTVPKLRGLLAERLRELDEKESALQALRAELKHLSQLLDTRANQPSEPCPPGAAACVCALGAPVELNFRHGLATS